MPAPLALPEGDDAGPRLTGCVLWYNAESGHGQLRPSGGGTDIFFAREEVTFVGGPDGELPTRASALTEDGATAPPRPGPSAPPPHRADRRADAFCAALQTAAGWRRA